jgi:periplasmic divalent cation tolerance protein
MQGRYSVILVTCPSRKEALRISGELLRKRLIACANITGRIDSVYRWKGSLERSTEVIMILKSVAARFRDIEREVKRLHSYEVPEIISLPVHKGSRDYLRWISESSRPKA